MLIGLFNWGGHGNWGDDAVATIIAKELGWRGFITKQLGDNCDAENYCDAYVVGGGTLIMDSGIFDNLIAQVGPERCIGFSLGVSDSWRGQGGWNDVLRKMPAVYVRDLHAFKRLKIRGIASILSADATYALYSPNRLTCREKDTAVNLMVPTIASEYFAKLENLASLVPGDRFALSEVEDLKTCPEATLFFGSDPHELIEYLSCYRRVISTRLHATIAAHVAEVPTIEALHYDPKVTRFLEYAATGTAPFFAELIRTHFDELAAALRKIDKSQN